MAATRLIPLHEKKGKTVSQCLKDRVDYSKNGEKTEKGEYQILNRKWYGAIFKGKYNPSPGLML